MSHRFSLSVTLAVVLALLISSVAMAAVRTNQPDYAPGSVVTISGDNSDNAGFQAGETVSASVSGPNAQALSCSAVVAADGSWSCQVTLSSDPANAGTYTYTAKGTTSGVSQTGSFTVTAPPPPPTAVPTQQPTAVPTLAPTDVPTVAPTNVPTTAPTSAPTDTPTSAPTLPPTVAPTAVPPTALPPTLAPTDAPTAAPTVAPTQPPFIQSDQADYAPGAPVTLTSGNWQPGETVHVGVSATDGQTWDISANVQADANGAFTYQFNLATWFVATYQVTATGAVSGTATTMFTDAVNINILGSDNTQHGNSNNPENLGSFAIGTNISLTCPRGNGLSVKAGGLGNTDTLGWSIGLVTGFGNDSTLSSLTTLTPSSGSLTKSSDTACVALTIATSTLTANTTYNGELQAARTSRPSASTGFYYFSFSVTKANATIHVTPYGVTYDGHAHTATGTATGIGGVDLSSQLSFSGTTHTNAGDYPSDTWNFAGNATYNSASGTVHDSIGQAPLSITANNDSKTYGQTRSYGAGSTAFTSSGLQNGETIGSVTVTDSGGTAANAAVGSYALAPSQCGDGWDVHGQQLHHHVP